MATRALVLVLAAASLPGLVASAAACGGGRGIIVASTTSTRDSGLLDELLPLFEDESGYNVKLIAVGSGQALAMGERGDADALLVHAPGAERELVEEGTVVNRRLVMHNDFVILGPPDDPAGIHQFDRGSAVKAMTLIADVGARFISRGDDSGTHQLERRLWRLASPAFGVPEEPGFDPSGRPWYEETGQGMAATLQVANQRNAYTISDRGTYLSQSENLDLVVLVEGDALLLNVYHVMQVNPERFDRVSGEGGRAFVEFMVSDEAQEVIRSFGVDEYGQPLFIPDAGLAEADLGLD